MTKQYKNPFEDPEEKLWDQKIKDYKIPKRKEEQKPAEPLEEKFESNPLVLQYEKDIKELRAKNVEVRKSMAFGYGSGLTSSAVLMLLHKSPSAYDVHTNLFFYAAYTVFLAISAIGMCAGMISTKKAIINSKKIKGLEKKIKELKK